MTFHVYTVTDAEGWPLYVGQTDDLPRRMREHDKWSPWANGCEGARQAALISVTTVATKAGATALEVQRIGELLPRWNVRHNPRGRLHWVEPPPSARARKEAALRALAKYRAKRTTSPAARAATAAPEPGGG